MEVDNSASYTTPFIARFDLKLLFVVISNTYQCSRLTIICIILDSQMCYYRQKYLHDPSPTFQLKRMFTSTMFCKH